MNTFKNDLNAKFGNKINKLKDLTLNQEKFNFLISELISSMGLDESINDEERKNEENNENDKKSKPQNQEQKTSKKEEKNEEMSIDAGVPDLENEASDSDKSEEELEIEDSSRPDLKKGGV